MQQKGGPESTHLDGALYKAMGHAANNSEIFIFKVAVGINFAMFSPVISTLE